MLKEVIYNTLKDKRLTYQELEVLTGLKRSEIYRMFCEKKNEIEENELKDIINYH